MWISCCNWQQWKCVGDWFEILGSKIWFKLHFFDKIWVIWEKRWTIFVSHSNCMWYKRKCVHFGFIEVKKKNLIFFLIFFFFNFFFLILLIWRSDVQVFNSRGNFLFKFGSYGQFIQPTAMCFDKDNNLFITDMSNNNVKKKNNKTKKKIKQI